MFICTFFCVCSMIIDYSASREPIFDDFFLFDRLFFMIGPISFSFYRNFEKTDFMNQFFLKSLSILITYFLRIFFATFAWGGGGSTLCISNPCDATAFTYTQSY